MEESVLIGAVNTIKQNRPYMIVEIEQRHINKPINNIFKLIEGFGYKLYFLHKEKLASIKSFELSKHQNEDVIYTDLYVNDFICFPRIKAVS